MDISVDIFADLCVCVCVYKNKTQFFLCPSLGFENHTVLMKSHTFLCVDDYFHFLACEFPSSHREKSWQI